MRRIGVAHLVRKKNGLEPVRRFLRSYLAADAGIEHDLIFIFKGFRNEAERAPYRELFGSLRYRTVDLPDRGYDITSYWLASEGLEHAYLCFLNSFSVIQAAGWLERLYRGVVRKGVALAGATGSYQSFRPSSLESYLKVSRRTRHRGPVKDLLMALPYSHYLNYLRRKLLFGRRFREFPNYHVRTNAFILSRRMMRQVLPEVPILTKGDSYRFESGRHGLTMQLLEMGFTPVAVGADGECYAKEDWHLSNTFWQSRQQNLMVTDKQTRQYSEGSPETRSMLAYLAWGELARPA